MSQWKKVKIDFKTIKLGNYIERIKTTVAEKDMKNPVVYGVTNKEGIVQTGKPSSKDISNYIVLEENCFAFNPYRINVGSFGINDNHLTGCVSPAYVVFKTKNGLLPKFLYFYLKSDYGNHLINWYGNRGGVRNALRYSDLCNIDIPDIRNINQELLLKKFSKISESINQINKELKKQKSYVKQLRQNILQNATEGKLTAGWRKSHHVIKGNPDYDAKALFEKIQKEKATDKKQKKLQPITDEEKTFEIPEGWKWVRLGEIINLLSGRDFEPSEYNDRGNGIPYITGASNFGENGIIINRWTPVPKCIAKNGDLLLVCKGSGYGTLAYADFGEAHIARQVMAITTISNSIELKYVEFILKANFDFLKSQGKGLIPGIDRETVLSIKTGLPSIQEQNELIQIVDKNLMKIQELEQQISQREEYANQLMQSILKDAFEEG